MLAYIAEHLEEIRDLVISALVLAFVFSYEGVSVKTIENFPYALFAISIAFLFHELAHRQTAKHFGCFARYKMWVQGLLLALVFAILSNGSFVFAAPGAVVIHPRIDIWGRITRLTKDEEGKIALAGPVMNLFLAIIFFIFYLIFALPIFYIATRINLWLCIFNLIPFPPLDGFSVFTWSRKVWLFVLAVALLIFAIA